LGGGLMGGSSLWMSPSHSASIQEHFADLTDPRRRKVV
jgi:hypothetical protein